MQFIDLKTQYNKIQHDVMSRIETVLSHGQYIMGPEVAELETDLQAFNGVKHAITCSSGTDAILMILMALGVGPGDAVFVPAFTFPATPEVVALLGAQPVFVDVDLETFNISHVSLEENILIAKKNGLNPKVIMPVDLYGMPADHEAIEAVAIQYDMIIISDAAQSFGASYKNKAIGHFGIATATSFFPAKPLGCYGDGGAIFTNDDELAEILKSIRVHGKGKNKYDNVRIGLNARLDTLQAAILIEKLKLFKTEVILRRKVAAQYEFELKGHVKTPAQPCDRDSIWAQYTISLPNRETRDALQTELKSSGIPTAVYYPEILPKQEAYKRYALELQRFNNSMQLADTVLSLPMHPYLSDQEISKVAHEVKRFVRSKVAV